MLWTTYRPQTHEIHSVSGLRPGCYQCGSDQHWGADCNARHAQRRAPHGPFSSAYASQFLSPDGDARVGGSGDPDGEAVHDDFVIMGRAQAESQSYAQTHANLPPGVAGAYQYPPPASYAAEPASRVGVSGPQYYYGGHSMASTAMPYSAPVSYAPTFYPVSMPAQLPPVASQMYYNPAPGQPGFHQAAFQPPLPNEPPPPFYQQGVSRPSLPKESLPPVLFSFVDRDK